MSFLSGPLAAVSAFSPLRKYVYLGILAVALAAVGYHVVRVASLKASIASAQQGKAEAEGALERRIGAEATAVTAAVQKARAEERAATIQLQKDYDELKDARAVDATQLIDARQRLLNLARQKRPACPGGGRLPEGSAAAGGTPQADGGELPQADRELIDSLLQLGAEANEAVRQRNLAVKQYQQNCQK